MERYVDTSISIDELWIDSARAPERQRAKY